MPSFQSQLSTGLSSLGISPAGGMVLAVSGGADSVALLLGIAELFPTQCSTGRILVAHLNHGLRGKASAGDEEFVTALADSLSLPHVVSALPINELHSTAGKSLEEAARDARYRFLQQVAEDAGFAAILTGHHQSDQAETVLHNMLRGTGLRGLAGNVTDAAAGRKLPAVPPAAECRP